MNKLLTTFMNSGYLPFVSATVLHPYEIAITKLRCKRTFIRIRLLIHSYKVSLLLDNEFQDQLFCITLKFIINLTPKCFPTRHLLALLFIRLSPNHLNKVFGNFLKNFFDFYIFTTHIWCVTVCVTSVPSTMNSKSINSKFAVY